MALGEMAELLAEQPHQIVDDTLARIRSVASPSRRGDVNDDVDRSEERCAR